MIQELGERKLYNEFEKKEAEAEDWVFVFDEDRILVRKGSNGRLTVPSAAFFEGADLQYLFRIEKDGYFLMKSDGESVIQQLLNDGYFWESTRNLRDLEHKELAFAASTAHHLYQWYRTSRFCRIS